MTDSPLREKVDRLVYRAALPAVLLPYGLWRLAVRQDQIWDAVILTVGSALTLIGVIAYRSTLFQSKSERTWSRALRTWAGFFPLAFISYLFFYKGLWGLVSLVMGFSIWSLLGSLFYAAFGLGAVKALEALSSQEMAAACAAEPD